MKVKVALLKLLDCYLGRLLVWILPRGGESPVPAQPESLLVIRPGGIGDAVWLIPVLIALRNKFPNAQIDVLAERRNAAVFGLCHAADRIMKYDQGGLSDVLRHRYDVVIDSEQWHRLSAVVARLTKGAVRIGFGTNERRKLFTHVIPYSHDDHESRSFFRLVEPLGVIAPNEAAATFLSIPEAARERVAALVSGVGQRPYVVLFPGASIVERRWGASKFHRLASRFNELGYVVVVIGGADDAIEGEQIVSGVDGIDLAGKTSLVESAAVIAGAALLVSGDSGMLHVGVGLGVRTVSLFGPGIEAKWAPQGERHRVVNAGLDCSPCTRFGYTPACSTQGRCLSEISVDDVFQVARNHLSRQELD